MMRFDGAFVYEVMHIVDGGFTLTRDEAEALCARLGSREEFVAWLLLRGDLTKKHREIGEALVAASASVVSATTTPRTGGGFPIFENQANLDIEAAMKSLVEASEMSRSAAETLQGKIGALASRQSRMNMIRQSLGLNVKES